MKRLFKFSIFILFAFGLIACGNKEETTLNQQTVQKTQQDNSEESSRVLTSEKGDTLYITYFAKGNEVAARIKFNGEERELEPKGISEKGNPVLSDGKYGWEIFVDGQSGRLFTTDNEGILFKEN